MKKIAYVLLALLPLAWVSCKEKKEANPLLAEWNTPHQTPPFAEIKHEHYLPAFEVAMAKGRAEVKAIAENPAEPTFDNTLVALDRAGSALNRVASVFFCINSAETDSIMDSIATQVMPLLTEYSNDISLNEQLFARIKKVYDQRDQLNLNGEQLRLLTETYDGFVRGGANLSAADKETFRTISKELSGLSLKFSQNVLAETNAFTLHITNEQELDGLPQPLKDAAAEEAKEKGLEGWVVTLQQPSYSPFMKYANNRALREKLYRASASRSLQGNEYDNRENIRQIADLRLQMANLFGDSTYADYALKVRMAETPARVNALLNEVLDASLPSAKKDVADLQAFAKSKGANFTLMPWDFSYYSEKLKAAKYSIDDEATRPYFALDRVIDGIFQLSGKLYGISFKENKDIPVYHPDVRAYEVWDKDSTFLSVLYLDFFPRAGKKGGAWMTTFREQWIDEAGNQRPIVSLVCNFSKPTADKPSLLTFYEFKTFLHEFGHGLHGIFANSTYVSQSGTNVLRDFVELPSQIMENFALEKDFLDMFAAHYQTGEKIPVEMVERIKASSNYQAGYGTVRQLQFGLLDMAYHSITKPLEGDIAAFERAALQRTQVMPVVEGTMVSPQFSHIFSGGYAAGYYSYMWAAVLDADAYSVFQQNGIFDQVTAQSFRDNILSKGNTEHPMELYKKFRGQEPTTDALLKRSGFKK